MDFYFGGIGKDHSWGLASDCPIVLLDNKRNEFIGLRSLEDAKKYEVPFDGKIYIWSIKTGNWEESQLVVLENRPAKVLGFKS